MYISNQLHYRAAGPIGVDLSMRDNFVSSSESEYVGAVVLSRMCDMDAVLNEWRPFCAQFGCAAFQGMTALMFAVRYDRWEIVKCLLEPHVHEPEVTR